MVYNLAVSLSRGVFTYTLTNTLFHQVIIVRKRPPLSFPQLLVCISLLCALTGALTLVASHTSPDRRFEQFTSQLFQEEMTGSTLNMHYTIADPKTFGISEYEPVLPIYHSGQPEDSKEHCSDLLHRLDRIDPDRLSPENAYTYRLLHRSLENDLALADFPYYNEPLSPSSGMQSQLPVLLAEYTFRTKRDVTDYLALLDQIDDYFASLLLYEQEKAAAGFFMPACSSEKVRKQCDTIVTTEELAQGTHFLQTTFEDRLSELQKQGLFTPEETASLIETNERLLATVVQPAYAALSEGLLSLETSTNVDSTASETTANAASGENNSAHNGLPKGLALLPDGKTYYLHLLFSETGSSRSEKELVQMLLVQFQKEQSAIRNLASQSLKVVLSGEGADEIFGGYNVYSEPGGSAYDKLPRGLRRGIGHIAEKMPAHRGRNFLVRKGKDLEERFIGNAYMFTPEERKALLKIRTNAPDPMAITKPFYDKVQDQDDVTKMQYLDLHMWMAGDILLKADKMSMANSLELRVPFLDKKVMELAEQIPTRYRVTREAVTDEKTPYITKYAMRLAAKKDTPPQTAKTAAKKKLGFPVPIRVWLKEDKYYSIVRERFESDEANRFFHTEKLVHLLDDHRAGKADNSRKIWTLYMFLVWYQIYFPEACGA